MSLVLAWNSGHASLSLPAFSMLGNAKTSPDTNIYPKHSASLDPYGKQWVNAAGGSPALSYSGKKRQ